MKQLLTQVNQLLRLLKYWTVCKKSERGRQNVSIKSGSLPTMAKNIAAAMPKKPTFRPPVVGTSHTNTRVKGVETERKVDIFVSRLNPHTAANELVDCVDTIKDDIDVRATTCVKLNSKYAHLIRPIMLKLLLVQHNSSVQLMFSRCPMLGQLACLYVNISSQRVMMASNTDLTICTYNCRSIKNSVNEVVELLNKFDIVMLQVLCYRNTGFCQLKYLCYQNYILTL